MSKVGKKEKGGGRSDVPTRSWAESAKKENEWLVGLIDSIAIKPLFRSEATFKKAFKMGDGEMTGYLFRLKLADAPEVELADAHIAIEVSKDWKLIRIHTIETSMAADLESYFNTPRYLTLRVSDNKVLAGYWDESTKGQSIAKAFGSIYEELFKLVKRLIAESSTPLEWGLVDNFATVEGEATISAGLVFADPENLLVHHLPGPPIGTDLLALEVWNDHLVALTSSSSGNEPVSLCIRRLAKDAEWIVVPSPKGMNKFPHKGASLTVFGNHARIVGGLGGKREENDHTFVCDLRAVADHERMPMDPGKLWRSETNGRKGAHLVAIESGNALMVFGGSHPTKSGMKYDHDVEAASVPLDDSKYVITTSPARNVTGGSVQRTRRNWVFGPGVERDGALAFADREEALTHDRLKVARSAKTLPKGHGMGALLLDDVSGRLPATYVGGIGPDGTPSDKVFVLENLASNEGDSWKPVGRCPYTAGPTKVVRMRKNLWAAVTMSPAGGALHFLSAKNVRDVPKI